MRSGTQGVWVSCVNLAFLFRVPDEAEAGVVASVLLKVSLSLVVAVVAREIQRADGGIDVG